MALKNCANDPRNVLVKRVPQITVFPILEFITKWRIIIFAKISIYLSFGRYLVQRGALADFH